MKATISNSGAAPRSFSTANRIGVMVLAAIALSGPIFAQSTTSSAPAMFEAPADGGGFFAALLTAANYFFYALYCLTPITIYQAWQKYKEGDQKGMGTYILGTIGIFCSPGIPGLIRTMTKTVSFKA